MFNFYLSIRIKVSYINKIRMRSILTFDNKGYIKAHSNGRNGHTIKTSIMELLQNADDANSNKIMIKYREKANMLIIADNGAGMPISKLENMSVLYRHEEVERTKHGKFGIGAKEAFLTLGGKWRVLTKQEGSQDISKLEWDSDKLVKWSNDEIEVDKYVSISDNASEVLRRYYLKTIKKLCEGMKTKDISGTVVIGELGTMLDNEKDELIEDLRDVIRDITLKHQKFDTTILYDIDLFDKDKTEMKELVPLDWLNYDNVEDMNKISFDFGVIERKNKRKYYNYYVKFGDKAYRFSKKNTIGFIEDEKVMDKECNFIKMSMTLLDEDMISNQEKVLRTNRKKLCGILVNRNGHYLYTEPTEWKVKNIPHNLRCELKYNNSDIDDIFKVKMNKSHFSFSQVNTALKKMVEYIVKYITNYFSEMQDLKASFGQVLETYKNQKLEKVEQKSVEKKIVEQESKKLGAMAPAWTYDSSVEKPAGEETIGTSTHLFYTQEQQERLGVDKYGKKMEKEDEMVALSKELNELRSKYAEMLNEITKNAKNKDHEIEKLRVEVERLQIVENVVEEEIVEPEECDKSNHEIIDALITKSGTHTIKDAEEQITIFKKIIDLLKDDKLALKMPNGTKIFAYMNASVKNLLKKKIIDRNDLLKIY